MRPTLRVPRRCGGALHEAGSHLPLPALDHLITAQLLANRFCAQQQTQYLHQFVLHASLDAVDEAMWSSKELHLKVVGREGG